VFLDRVSSRRVKAESRICKSTYASVNDVVKNKLIRFKHLQEG